MYSFSYPPSLPLHILFLLHSGQSFGETALESVGGLRTAGAVVTQNAKLMVLHADQFKVEFLLFCASIESVVVAEIYTTLYILIYVLLLVVTTTITIFAGNSALVQDGAHRRSAHDLTQHLAVRRLE